MNDKGRICGKVNIINLFIVVLALAIAGRSDRSSQMLSESLRTFDGPWVRCNHNYVLLEGNLK